LLINHRFQFDAPVQAGARQQSGFSLCGNNSLALGSSAVFYQCFSGNLYNLYSQSQGGQCFPIFIEAVRQGSGSGVSQISDGQPQATQPPRVSQISDGQPQASRPAVVSQISDGQPQAPSPTSRAVVSQISDGQPQAPRPTTSRAVVSQISDGQPQAPRPTSSRAVVSQISDGQPQAALPTRTGNLTSPVNSTRTAAPSQFTGAAATGNAATGALLAGLLGLFAML
jgi:hypothetical protein